MLGTIIVVAISSAISFYLGNIHGYIKGVEETDPEMKTMYQEHKELSG